jgi:hypothetical protein
MAQGSIRVPRHDEYKELAYRDFVRDLEVVARFSAVRER